MNISKILVTATLIAAAGSALAESAYPIETPFVPTKTRAEVVAQLTQAGDQARVNYANSFNPIPQEATLIKKRTEPLAQLANVNGDVEAATNHAGH